MSTTRSLGSIQDSDAVVDGAKEVREADFSSVKDSDYRKALTDKRIDSTVVQIKDPPAGSTLEAMVNVVQKEDIQPGKERVYARTVFTPILRVVFGFTHGVGPEPKKFNEDDVASRTYGLTAGTWMDDETIAAINDPEKGMGKEFPGYDVKKEHRFFVAQMKKLIEKTQREMFKSPKVRADDKASTMTAEAADLEEAIIKKAAKDLSAGDITQEEYDRIEQDATPDSEELNEKCYKQFLRNFGVGMMPDKEHKGEWLFSFKIKVWKKEAGATLPKVRPEDVSKRYNELTEGKKLSRQEQRDTKADVVKQMCEAIGYEYNQITYTTHNNVPLKPAHYRQQILWTNFCVRIGFSPSGNSIKGKGGKYGLKFRGKNRIQIIRMAEPPSFDEDPDEIHYGDNWTIASIAAMVGADRMKVNATCLDSNVPDVPEPVALKRKANGVPLGVEPLNKRVYDGDDDYASE